ncbi:antibiotic biosynthesis monooxygenase [Planktotalea sp.]|uniref:antibiotic biosynthesis monooxygenase n=1 Tax=Planktotalea sp. TaxID=2029877 RepID=UPI0032972D98
MHLISVNGVEVSGLMNLFKFFRLAFALRKQGLASAGCLSFDMFRFESMFYLVAVWNSAPAMEEFQKSDLYQDLIQNRRGIVRSASGMLYESKEMPTREVVVAQWRRDKG